MLVVLARSPKAFCASGEGQKRETKKLKSEGKEESGPCG